MEINDSFPEEHLYFINTLGQVDTPWFTYFANYLIARVLPKDITSHLEKKFFANVKHYTWDDPYLF